MGMDKETIELLSLLCAAVAIIVSFCFLRDIKKQGRDDE